MQCEIVTVMKLIVTCSAVREIARRKPKCGCTARNILANPSACSSFRREGWGQISFVFSMENNLSIILFRSELVSCFISFSNALPSRPLVAACRKLVLRTSEGSSSVAEVLVRRRETAKSLPTPSVPSFPLDFSCTPCFPKLLFAISSFENLEEKAVER